ncbi:MAG: hypothetical protein IKE46_11120 [Selenomonadaceae bacterium]|nr:hypothetical protein [Selenomonadaceae bacterium]
MTKADTKFNFILLTNLRRNTTLHDIEKFFVYIPLPILYHCRKIKSQGE